MSPVFGHGRLRLYLLKLLEESPRHGYEVIRLLQDRFLGVYSPSPGTIYPRLARLEEEGLVTHEVVNGKKVYTLTDKGRGELERRMDELAALEEEITASAQSFAREVQEDVRHTVRSLREELTQAARQMTDPRRATSKQAWQEHTERQRQEWRRQTEYWREQGDIWMEEWRHTWEDAVKGGWNAVTGTQEEAASLKLERALRQFVDDVRKSAHRADHVGPPVLDEETLAAARALLAETADRLKNDIFRNPE